MWPYYPTIYAHFLLWVRYQFSARSSSCFLVSFLTFLVWFHPFPSILFQFLVCSLCSIIFPSGCHIVFPSCPYFPHVSLIFHSFPMLLPRTPLSQKRSPEPFTAGGPPGPRRHGGAAVRLAERSRYRRCTLWPQGAAPWSIYIYNVVYCHMNMNVIF